MIGLIIIVLLVVGVFFFKSKRINANNNTSTVTNNSNQTQEQVNQNTILIKNFSFSPNVLTIKKGTTVTWTNQDSVVHTIKSDTFNSSDLSQGDRFQFTFNNSGTFNYSCGIHPNMTGTIVVE